MVLGIDFNKVRTTWTFHFFKDPTGALAEYFESGGQIPGAVSLINIFNEDPRSLTPRTVKRLLAKDISRHKEEILSKHALHSYRPFPADLDAVSYSIWRKLERLYREHEEEYVSFMSRIVPLSKDALPFGALGTKTVIGNIFLIEGVNFMWTCINTGSCSPPFDGSNTHIGVGDGTAAADPTQTGLQGANVYYKLVDSGYPVINQNSFTARATFGPTEANFSWQEWTVANGSDNTAINLNRKVESLGTKASGATWVLEVTLSIS